MFRKIYRGMEGVRNSDWYLEDLKEVWRGKEVVKIGVRKRRREWKSLFISDN